MAIALNQLQANFPCRLCGSAALRPYYRLGHHDQFKYFRCPTCALVNYDLSGGLDQNQYIELIDPTDDNAIRNHDKDASWSFIERWLPGPGAFLDVGCGTGRLLYLAHRAGWDACGLELSDEAAKLARDVLGMPVTVGDFLTIDPENAKYDLVALRHVLEHLVDPILALEKINARLKPNGYALFEMPNIEGIDKRLKRLLANADWHRKRFAEDYVPGHCNEFCRASFEFLLLKSGFELIRWETYSMKPVANFIYTRIHIGNKARALVKKISH